MSQTAGRPYSRTPRDRSKRLTRVFPSAHPSHVDSEIPRSQSARSLYSTYRASEPPRHSPPVLPLPRNQSNRRAAIVLPSPRVDPPSPLRSSAPAARRVRDWGGKAADPVLPDTPPLKPRALESGLSVDSSESALTQDRGPLPAQIRKSNRYRTTFDIGFTGIVDDQKTSFLDLPPPPARLSFLPSCGDSDSDRPSSPSGWCDSTDTIQEIPIGTRLSPDSSDTSSFSLDPEMCLGFPQPPSARPPLPRDASGVLRDPDSGAPLVTPQETGAVRDFLRERWAARVKARGERHRAASRTATSFRRNEHIQRKDDGDSVWEARTPPDVEDLGGDQEQGMDFQVHELNGVHVSSTPPPDYVREHPQETSAGGNVNEDDVSMVLRFLRALEDGEDLQHSSVREDCASALAESMLELDPSLNTPSRGQGSADTRSNHCQEEKRRYGMSMRSFSFPAQELSAHARPHAAPLLLPPANITSSKSARPRGMSKIVRKVASMSLGADREGTQATDRGARPSPVHTSPRRSSALIRLDASVAKLRAHHHPWGSQPSNPSSQLHHTKSQSFGCMKLGKTRNSEIASGCFDKTPAESSAQRLGPTRIHHLKSRSLACLTKTGRHTKLEPVNEHHVYEPRPSPRHLSAQTQQNVPRSRSFGSLKPHRSPIHLEDGFSQPVRHGHTPSQSEKWIKRSTRGYVPTIEYQHVKSFIDVTPEQRKRSSSGLRLHKERIKKFLARASGGMMGWGKFLARKA